jgi:hypothetical protein
MCGAASASSRRPPEGVTGPGGARSKGALWLLCALLAGGGCSRLARCELDKVRSEVLDYDVQMAPLRTQEAELRRRMVEFDDKIFTNQKAGVDLLRAVLVAQAREFLTRLMAVPVRSHLLRPHHQRKIAAYARVVAAYETLMKAYPREDFDAVRQGLTQREVALRELEAADLRLRRLLQKYRSQKH